MGNLRQIYTDDEWNEIGNKVKQDRKNGKPDDFGIYLMVLNKPLEELIEIKKALLKFYDEYALSELNEWIAWKKYENGIQISEK